MPVAIIIDSNYCTASGVCFYGHNKKNSHGLGSGFGAE